MDLPHIIVIGGSAGAHEPLQRILAGLPLDIGAAVFVVLHLGSSPSVLPEILQKHTKLLVLRAEDGQLIEPGRVYVAPSDLHLLVEPGKIAVARGPRENRTRPAIDPLFRSAAYAYGPRVTGVILSGCLDDGVAGLWAIKQRGGTAIVQAPPSAEFDSMPLSALQHVAVDYVLEAEEIASVLRQITERHSSQGSAFMPDVSATTKSIEIETRIASGHNALQIGVLELGPASRFSCPECHGVLGEVRHGNLLRFRCHTGHAYTARTLLSQSVKECESTLGEALRAFEERLLLLVQLAGGKVEHDDSLRDEQFKAQIEVIRSLLQETRLELASE